MKVILSGYYGHMCQEICKKADQNFEIIAGVSKFIPDGANANVPVFKTFADIDKQNNYSVVDADCIIDFSHRDALEDVLSFALAHKIALVIATTGHTDEQVDKINAASKVIPIFYAANYSIGIALLIQHAKQIALTLSGADIEIVEVHHNRKADAPSGTALAIARELKTVLPDSEIVEGRSGMNPRKPGDIGISSVRMGNITGIHEVHICTQTECITLKHEAFTRSVFADGAIKATVWLIGKTPGLYSMADIAR